MELILGVVVLLTAFVALMNQVVGLRKEARRIRAENTAQHIINKSAAANSAKTTHDSLDELKTDVRSIASAINQHLADHASHDLIAPALRIVKDN